MCACVCVFFFALPPVEFFSRHYYRSIRKAIRIDYPFMQIAAINIFYRAINNAKRRNVPFIIIILNYVCVRARSYSGQRNEPEVISMYIVLHAVVLDLIAKSFDTIYHSVIIMYPVLLKTYPTRNSLVRIKRV